LPLAGAGAAVYETIKEYKDTIISIGVVMAVVDLFFTTPAHLAGKSRKKH